MQNVQESASQQANKNEFEVDVNNFKALGESAAGTDGIGESTQNVADPVQAKDSLEDEPGLKTEAGADRVQNVEEDGNGFFITGINTGTEKIDEKPSEPEDPADKYKHVAVVDCSKAFSNSECVLISDKNKSMTYLNSNSSSTFKFDCLVTSHN